jgi:hypothetical protein
LLQSVSQKVIQSHRYHQARETVVTSATWRISAIATPPRSTPAQPPQILPAPLAMHALSGPGRNPPRDFWARPDSAFWSWILQRLAKITLLVLREDGRCAQAALPPIR